MELAQQTRNYVEGKIEILKNMPENRVKAILANLRQALGKHPGEIPAAWEAVLADMPQALLGKGEKASYGENAVHTAMTLFALHQQGKDLNEKCMHEKSDPSKNAISVGKAMAGLVNDDNSEAIKKRFDRLVTSDSYEELAYHLRGVIQLLRRDEIKLDYGLLSEQLYKFQFSENRNGIRLSWGRDYYDANKIKKY